MSALGQKRTSAWNALLAEAPTLYAGIISSDMLTKPGISTNAATEIGVYAKHVVLGTPEGHGPAVAHLRHRRIYSNDPIWWCVAAIDRSQDPGSVGPTRSGW